MLSLFVVQSYKITGFTVPFSSLYNVLFSVSLTTFLCAPIPFLFPNSLHSALVSFSDPNL